MAKGRSSKTEHNFRVNKVAKLLSVGTTRSEIIQFVSDEYGVTERTADNYMQDARAILKKDFDIAILIIFFLSMLLNIRFRG